MSHGNVYLQNRLQRMNEPVSECSYGAAAQTPTFPVTEDGGMSKNQADSRLEDTSPSNNDETEEYERILASPGTGLERVGLKRNTSIIEKLTNLTYNSLEREDDRKLLNYIENTKNAKPNDQE